MKVSVVLAIYNEDKYYQACLNSLCEQRGVESEVIVVDDGSYHKIPDNNNDKSGKTAIKIFHISHGGTAVARNFGASKANGEILVFVDGDMTFTPEFLSTLCQPIITATAKGTYSTQEYVANWENPWARCWNYEQGLVDELRIKTTDNMNRDFRAILKSEFDRVGGFDNIGYTDTWSLSRKLGYKPQATATKYYHYNPETMSEVINQALWIGRRRRRFGIFGKIAAIIRASLPISIVYGVAGRIKYREPVYLKFKIVYDLAIMTSLMNSFFTNKTGMRI